MGNPWVATNEDMLNVFNQCLIRDNLLPRSVYIDGSIPVEYIEYKKAGGELLFTIRVIENKIVIELSGNAELTVTKGD